MILKEMPKEERPREKLIIEGPDHLSLVELVAIILRTGYKDEDVMEISHKLLSLVDNVTELPNLTLNEILEIKGIGEAKAITLYACFELGKRIANYKKVAIDFKNPESIHNYFYNRVKDFQQEHLYALYLDTKGKIISIKELTIGTINATLIDSKLIFKWAFKFQANGIILVHNHPSGDSYPSIADVKMTMELIKQAKIVNFTIYDHIIIGEKCFSMRRDMISNRLFN